MEASNSQKMREAVEKADAALSRICKSAWFTEANFDETVEVMDARSAICQAISTPPRNCDVGTAKEQMMRWQEFCKMRTSCDECPCHKKTCIITLCFAHWAQMPYGEGGAK